MSSLLLDLGGVGKITTGDLVGIGGGIASLAGGFVGASGAQQAGAAQSRGYLADAAIQGENAATARDTTARNQRSADYQFNRYLGRVGADYGAAGVSLSGGSPLDVMGDAENEAKIEAMNRMYQGDLKAKAAGDQYDFDVQAAKDARDAAKTKSNASILGGIGGFLLPIARIFGFGPPLPTER